MLDNDFIKEIETRIKNLEHEKSRIEKELAIATNYLQILTGTSSSSIKSNQTPEAKEKMRKAQKERQERERKQRKNTICEFLKFNGASTTEEVAKELKLSVNTAKRYLRATSGVEEVQIGIWEYLDIPF